MDKCSVQDDTKWSFDLVISSVSCYFHGFVRSKFIMQGSQRLTLHYYCGKSYGLTKINDFFFLKSAIMSLMVELYRCYV